MSRIRKFGAPLTHRNLPLLLLQSRERIMARFRPVLNARRLTEQQWRIIRVLLDSGPLEPRQIGELCSMSSASLAGVLARMEQIELVSRKRLRNDQRRVQVELTSSSRTLAARVAPQIEAIYLQVEIVLGKALCDELYGTLDAVIAKLSKCSRS